MRPATAPPGPAVVVAIAVACWAGTLLGVAVTAAGGLRAVEVAAPVAVLVAVAAGLPGRRGRLAAARAATAVVLAVAGCAAGVAAARVMPLVAGELVAAAAQGQHVSALVRLTGDPRLPPRQVSGSQRLPDRLIAAATLLRWSRAGTSHLADLPVVLVWSGSATDLSPGTVLAATGRLAPGEPVRQSAALLAADRVTVAAAAPPIQRGAQALRDSLRRSAATVDGDGGALLPGLVLGDTGAVPPELDQAMRDSGLAHLTAVSGGNVAVTLALLWWVARRLGLRRRGLVVVGALALPAYVVLVRPDPSVVRAAVMAAIGLAALLGGRRTRGLPVLAVAVTVLLLLDPFLAVSVGFALSVVATGALVTVGRRWSRRGALRLPRVVVAAWAAAAAASLATAPLIAAIGGGVPLLSVPANVLAAPAVAPAGVLGLLAAVVGLVAPVPAGLLTVVAAVPAGWIAGVARRSASVPAAVLAWPEGVTGALLLTAVLGLSATAVVLAGRAGRRRAAVSTLTAFVLALVVLPAAGVRLPVAAWPPAGWVMVACDVGQGDGLVLRAGPGAAVVVDAGPDPRAMDRCLTRLGVRTVPVLVLSHFHADHVEGMPGVLRSGRTVSSVVVSPLAEPVEEAARVRGWSAAAGLGLRVAGAGESQVVGELTWTVLSPDRVRHGTDSDPNNDSLVLLVHTAGISLLLGADIEPVAQQELLRQHPTGPVDVVKVPHHGSAHQDPQYAAATHPAIALISCGIDNDYGHPAPATVRSYLAVGAALGRTDTDGDLAVTVAADGRPVLAARGRGPG